MAEAFFDQWIARYGIPEAVLTDQGSQFESDLFTALMQCMGINKLRTTAFHPQTNGKIERMHRTIKESLRSLRSSFTDWEAALPMALLSLRNALGHSGFSPAQLLFTESLSLPQHLIARRPDEGRTADYDITHPSSTTQLSR